MIHRALFVLLLATVASHAHARVGGGAHRPSSPASKWQGSGAASPANPATVSMPAGTGGIGFDDIRYSSGLDVVLVPAGHTGNIDLLEPSGSSVSVVGGFSREKRYTGDHDVGTTSADSCDGVIVASDRTVPLVAVVDPKARAILASASLAARPDLVRCVAPTREIWVTEPDAERIEIFSLDPTDSRRLPTHSAFIATPGGPESLTIDSMRRRAYSHLGAMTVAFDLASRAVVTRWSTGCTNPKGVALDEPGALLFVGCSDGQIVVLDLTSGTVRDRRQVGAKFDHIAFSASRRHLYVPDTERAEMTIFSVSRGGHLSQLGRLATARGTECVTTDDRRHVYLCDPTHGAVLIVTDDYAASASE